MRCHLLFLPSLLVLFSGCQDTSKLESSLAEFKSSFEARLDAMEQKLAKIDVDAMNKESEELKIGWDSFQKSFSPELRQELGENLAEVLRKKASMEEVELAVAAILTQLKQMESESKQFRDQAEQHSIQAKEFDKIGMLEQALGTLRAELAKVEAEVQQAASTAGNAERMARSAEGRARDAERKAADAEREARFRR
jgi:hypothetical protein